MTQVPSHHGPLKDGPKHRQNGAAGLAAFAQTVPPDVARHFSRPVPHAQAVRAEDYEHHQTEGTRHPEGGETAGGGKGQGDIQTETDIYRDKKDREEHMRQIKRRKRETNFKEMRR